MEQLHIILTFQSLNLCIVREVFHVPLILSAGILCRIYTFLFFLFLQNFVANIFYFPQTLQPVGRVGIAGAALQRTHHQGRQLKKN